MDQLDIEIETNKTVSVLGRNFNSEEERRGYFRNELRKKLPELKQLEGFPIGEDEDIINLSDPPYYTACPNPWLKEFIAEWEEEKKELEIQGKRSFEFEVEEPYASDISEGKNNPIYNAHSYHTKVPHPAIMRYVLHYTQPGDIIYDGFAGTGMTGVAASMCGSPDSELKYILEKEYKDSNDKAPNWGYRKSICNDLSPIASFIASNYINPTDGNSFNKEFTLLLKEFNNKFKWMYKTKHNQANEFGDINYIIWSDCFFL